TESSFDSIRANNDFGYALAILSIDEYIFGSSCIYCLYCSSFIFDTSPLLAYGSRERLSGYFLFNIASEYLPANSALSNLLSFVSQVSTSIILLSIFLIYENATL